MNNINDILSSKIDSFLGSSTETNDQAQDITVQHTQPAPTSTPQFDSEKVKEYICQIEGLLQNLKAELTGEPSETRSIPKTHSPVFVQTYHESANTCEGVFNGECMIGSDGKRYPVPPNYASKSKLVEGDMLKVTATPNGTLIFKQIGPIERERLIGELTLEEDGTFRVICDGKPLRLLTAAVTFHKGKPGEQIVILTPKGTPSKWAAVEYIIRD